MSIPRALKDIVAEWWLTNARIRHGHPPEDSRVTTKNTSENTSNTSIKTDILKKSTGSFLKTALPWLLVAALGAHGVMPWVAFLTGKSEEQPPAAPSERNGSIYQYLEDNNWHLQN